MSASHFLRAVRVERATGLLRGRTGCVAEVADAVGFDARSSFHRALRERDGVAPSEVLSAPHR